MGGLSDRIFDAYGAKDWQYDIRKDCGLLNIAYQKASFAQGITNSIFNFAFNLVDAGCTGGGSSSRSTASDPSLSDGQLTATGEEIRSDIQKLLEKNGFYSIEELDAEIDITNLRIESGADDATVKHLRNLEALRAKITRKETTLKNLEGQDGENEIEKLTNEHTSAFTEKLRVLITALKNNAGDREIDKAARDVEDAYNDFSGERPLHIRNGYKQAIEAVKRRRNT
jgi:hypothetical protein